jgi:hypothetical protein
MLAGIETSRARFGEAAAELPETTLRTKLGSHVTPLRGFLFNFTNLLIWENISIQYFESRSDVVSCELAEVPNLLVLDTMAELKCCEGGSDPRAGTSADSRTAAPATVTENTIYRRPLPESCVSFSSPQGRRLFAAASVAGTTDPFFPLVEQFRTQDDPAFCGLSTLVMVLNAMAIDPQRVWKGVWRWFHEEMLSCCKPIEEVKKKGISLQEFACLARCNGAAAAVFSGADMGLEKFRAFIRASCSDFGAHGFVCLNYNRKVLGQTGTGHFSPVAAYEPSSDTALLLDVARFKYPPHWVPLALLHKAIGEQRGFAILKPATTVSGAPLVGSCKCEIEGFDAQTGLPV